MPRRAAFAFLLAWVGTLPAAPPPGLAALEKHTQQVGDAAKPSIACILVSRSNKYAEFGEGPKSDGSGKLGAFTPTRHRFSDAAHRDLIRRLDLANTDTVPEAYGSGIVVDASGLVLTTYRVIAGARKVFVRLPGEGRGSYADILAADARSDLAVLKMISPPADLKAVRLGDGGKARQGGFVVALANPFAAGFRDGNPSLSFGTIANIRRRAPGPTDEIKQAKLLSQYPTLLQTDGRLSFGCSGGALFNLDGEVIGMTTALAAIAGAETAGGFAIPFDTNTRKMIDVLMRGEEIEYGFLGVSVRPDDRTDSRGVPIADVHAGMPAARAGLLSGDVVMSINGNPVREQDDLFLNISAAQAGSVAEITVSRGGTPRTVKARLAKASHGEAVIAANRQKPVHGLRVDYASTLSIDTNPPEGVLVKELEPGSPAEKKLKEWADRAKLIVVAVDGRPVPTPAEFYRLTAGKASVTLDIVEAVLNPDTTRAKKTLP